MAELQARAEARACASDARAAWTGRSRDAETALESGAAIVGVLAKVRAPEAEAEFGLNEEQTLAVFRILQESLSNVARHAQASDVQIELAAYPGGFSMTVADNGKGLQPGDRWCLCAPRWREALDAGCAPRVVLGATHEASLEFASLADFKKHAIDLS